MDLDAKKFKTLGNLLNRVVRGIKPGAFNARSACKVFLTTDSSSDSSPVKEYLIEASVGLNTVKGEATFVSGSKVVKAAPGSSFKGIQKGDIIRRESRLNYYAVVSVSSDNKRIDLSSDYQEGPVGETFLASFVARKTSADSAMVSITENSELAPSSFSYDQTRGKWVTSSVSSPSARVRMNGDLVDGISLHCIGRGASPIPDVASTGVVLHHKVTAPAGHDSASLPLPAVPYPADESGVVIQEAPAGSSSYSTLGKDDFFLDYTGLPVPTLDQPLFLKRKDARLLRTKKEMAYLDITGAYGGQWAVQDSKVRHTAMLFGSEEVTIGDASNPAYVSDDIELSGDDVRAGRRKLSHLPIGKVVLNVAEGSAQSDGLDFVVVDGELIWKGYGLEEEVYEGLILRVYYQASGVPDMLYPYMDYLVEPSPGVITTVNQQAGAIFSVQYIVLSGKDVRNKYVQLASAPIGPVAVNITAGSSARLGHDFDIKGNRLVWGGFGLDTDSLTAGTTIRVSYQSGSGEYPVEYIFQRVEAFWFGATAYRSKTDPGGFDMSSSSSWGDKLVLGTDWDLNSTNGSVALTGAVADDDTTLFEYLGKGIELVHEVLDPSISPAGEVSDKLRLRYSPVVPGTVTVYSVGSGPKELLISGMHYHIAPGTGSLTVLSPLRPGARWHVSYMPAIAYYYALKGKCAAGAEMPLRAILEPARVASSSSIAVFNKFAASMSLSSLVVRKASGEVLPLTGVRFNPESSRLTFVECKALTPGQVVMLDYDFTSKNLPFAPVVQLSNHIKKGSDLLYVDGTRVDGVFSGGKLIGLAGEGSSTYEILSIKNVLNVSGANVCVQLSGEVSETMLSPSVIVSNKAVSFSPVEGLVLSSYSADQSCVTAIGRHDYTVLPGMIMRVYREASDREELYKVLSCTYNEDTQESEISVSPQTKTSSTGGSTVTFSTSPVYMAGDTAIVTKYPLLTDGFPLWKIEYAVDNGGYATLQVNKSSAVLREYLPEGTVEHKMQLDNYATVDELAVALAAAGGGRRFSLKWLYPKGAGIMQSSLLRTDGERELPYEVLSRPQLRKKSAGEDSFRPLKYGAVAGSGDYRALGRHIILEAPIEVGDQYTVSYVGIDNLARYRGRSLQVVSRRVVPIPESTKYDVSYEYLREDQSYIQTMTEADFLEKVAAPVVDGAEEAREGQSPFGCLSTSSSSGQEPSSGGFFDSMHSLRDEFLKYNIFKKILDYYNKRYLRFSQEYASITGVRPCRSITSDDQGDQGYTLIGTKELDHYATFGQAGFFPDGHESPTPVPDGRFSGSYLSFGSAHFFNHKGSAGKLGGVMLSKGGGFLSRGLSAGDAIKAECHPGYLIISKVVSEEEIRFTTKIPWKGDSGYKLMDGSYKQKVRPVFSWMGSPTYKDAPMAGTRYWVRSSSAMPPVSQDGSPFASVKTSIGEPFPLSQEPSCSNVLCLETSVDGGQTWSFFSIDLSFVGNPFTADRLASIITSGFSQAPPSDPEATEVVKGLGSVMEVTSSTSYVSSGVDVGQSLSDEWPLRMPTKEGHHGSGKVLVFTAKSTDVWFRFVEPAVEEDGDEVVYTGASTLGLPVGYVHKGSADYWSARLSLSREKELREKELELYDRMLSAFDATDRGERLVYGQPTSIVLGESIKENKAAIESIRGAKEAAEGVAEDDEGTDAMQASAAKAKAAAATYSSQISLCADTSSEDDLMAAVLSEPGASSRHLASLERVSVDEESVNDYAVQTYLEDGKPSIMLPAAKGFKVLLGFPGTHGVCGVSSAVTSTGDNPSAHLHPLVNNEDLKVIHIRGQRTVFRSSVSVSSNQVLISYQLSEDSSSKEFSVPLKSCPTLDGLVTAINKEVSGVLVATLNRGQLSLEDFSRLGGTPSSRLLPVAPSAAPAYLSMHGRPYSEKGSAYVSVKPAISVMLSGQSVSMSASPDGVSVLLKDGSEVSVPLRAGDTFSSYLSRATTTLAGLAALSLTGDVGGDERCVGFISSPGLLGSLFLYPSVKGGLEYGVLSDRKLQDRIKVVRSRLGFIKKTLGWHAGRKVQIEASVGDKGEDLPGKQYEWLCLLVDKEIGPCTRIPQLKKRILSSRLYRAYLSRNTIK